MRVIDIKKVPAFFFPDRTTSIVFSLALVFLLCGIISGVFPSYSIQSYGINEGGTVPIGEIYDDQSLSLEYKCTQEGLSGITFSVATYAHVLKVGTLFISIENGAGKEIYSKEYPASSIADNAPLEFSFPEQRGSKSEQYTVLFRTDGLDRNHSITFWANGNASEGVSTVLNGVHQPNSLVFSVMCNSKSYRYTWDLFLLCGIFLTLTVVSQGRVGSKKFE